MIPVSPEGGARLEAIQGPAGDAAFAEVAAGSSPGWPGTPQRRRWVRAHRDELDAALARHTFAPALFGADNNGENPHA